MGIRTEEITRQMRQLFDCGQCSRADRSRSFWRDLLAEEGSPWSNLHSTSAEAAFETLVARHGTMVLSVCRQILGDMHAAEDAFQATFLVLIRRSNSFDLRGRDSLGPWLYGVAYPDRHQGSATRRAQTRAGAPVSRVPATKASAPPAEIDDLRSLLHEEVSRLPAIYRDPVVLCYFEGRTHDEAAAALHWPVGTVRGRLARARDLLRSRLTRRGLRAGHDDCRLRHSSDQPRRKSLRPSATRQSPRPSRATPAGATVAALTRYRVAEPGHGSTEDRCRGHAGRSCSSGRARGWWCGRRSRFSRPNRLDAAKVGCRGEARPRQAWSIALSTFCRRAAERAWGLSGSVMVTVYLTPSTRPRVTWWSPSAPVEPLLRASGIRSRLGRGDRPEAAGNWGSCDQLPGDRALTRWKHAGDV